jgi:hypothetical protein
MVMHACDGWEMMMGWACREMKKLSRSCAFDVWLAGWLAG